MPETTAAAAPTSPMTSGPGDRGPRQPMLGAAGGRLAALLVAVLVLLGGSFAGITAQDHEAALEDGWTVAERAALGAAEHAGRSLAAARLVTDRVAEGIRRDGAAGLRGAGRTELAAMLQHAPEIGSLWVLDAQGRLIANSLESDPPGADFSDRPYFAPLRAGQEVQLAPLLFGRLSGVWFFSFNRAVRDGAGAFLGVVQAAMHVEEFQRFQRALGLGPAGRVGLFRAADGAPLMLFPLPPDADSAGAPPLMPGAPPPEVLRAAASQAASVGRFEQAMPDGDRLLVAWRLAGPGGAVLATAALSRSEALAPSRARLLRNGVLFGMAAAVLAVLGFAVATAVARGAAMRRAAEAGRRELSATLEATGEGVVALDAEWRIRFVNTRASLMLADGADITGQPLGRALPDLVGGPVWDACERTLRGEGRVLAEVELPSLGRRFRAESHPRADGGVVVFFRDISEERAAAAKLAETEARLRRVLDNLFVFVGVLARDGTLLEANRAPLDAAGLTLADVQGKPFWECYWWAHDAATQARLREACARAAAGEASRYDVEVRVVGDSRIMIDFQIAPLRDAAGLVTHLIPSATDVTARRQAEAALAESEARLRLAQEAAEVGVFEFDFRRRAAHWSTAMFRLYGLDPTGRGPIVQESEFAALLHPQDRETQRIRRDAAWSAPDQARFGFEFRICLPATGEVRWIASRGEVVRDAEGRPLLLRGVNFDITERRRAEERQLLLAREVDHRAKNALAVVQAIVGLTRHDDPEQFRAAVTGRIAAMARAHTLLAREGWGRAELRELIGEELAPHRGGLAGAVERVVLTGPPVALAAGAAQPLAMALHELATNAAKHGALSSPTGHVAVGWAPAEDGGLLLRWTEAGGPALDGPPARIGFGSSVVRNTVERQLGGAVAFDWLPEGLVATLSLPPAQLRWPDATAPGARPASARSRTSPSPAASSSDPEDATAQATRAAPPRPGEPGRP